MLLRADDTVKRRARRFDSAANRRRTVCRTPTSFAPEEVGDDVGGHWGKTAISIITART
jgi:hypothetical protein